MLVLALLLLWPVAARAGGWEAAPRLRVGLGLGVDANPQRVAGDAGAEGDVLGDLVAQGTLDLTGPVDGLSLEGETGVRAYTRTPAEDRLAWRLAGRWRHRLGARVWAGVDAAWQDRLQRGVPLTDWTDPSDWACRVPEGESPGDWRCGRRDYRQLDAAAVLRWALTKQGTVGASAGMARYDYKPDARFSWWGPRANLHGTLQLSRRQALLLQVGVGVRRYPTGSSFVLVTNPDSGVRAAVPTGDARDERRYALGAGWRLKGPLLLELTWTTSRSVADGDALDVLRHRLELAGATRLGDAVTLLVAATLQLAHWPEGNALRGVLPVEEGEQMSSLAAKLTWRVAPPVALVLEARGQANEWVSRPEDALPYRRWLLQTGAEVTLGR